MKYINSKRRATARERKLAELQVREYIVRYHPEMLASKVEISACGNFAQVKRTDPALQNSEKTSESQH